MIERIVPRFPECVSHLDGAERVDVQVARSLPEESGLQESIAACEEVFLLEEIKDFANLPVNLIDVAGEGVECAIEECEQVLFIADVTCCDAGEDVHPEGGLGPEFGFNRLGLAAEILVHEVVDLIDVLREQNRLAVLVVLRAAGPAAHLFDFKDRDGGEAEVHVETVQVANDDPAGREVDSR